MTFTIILFLIALLGPIAFFHASRKKSRLAEVSWETLMSRLEAVPIQGITRVAVDYLQPQKGQLQIQTDELWQLIDGQEGLRRMEANAEVLIALAGYASQWNLEESLIVAERMRRDGLNLRRAVSELTTGILVGRAAAMGPFCVQEAASAYYLMRQRLLALYETSHAGRYPHLAAVL